MAAEEHERQSLGWHQRRPFAQLALHDAQLLVEGDDLTVGVHAGEVQGGGYAAGVLEDAPLMPGLLDSCIRSLSSSASAALPSRDSP